MARQKFDGVVETVRYKPSGEVDWVRAYERRGTTFSDHLLIDRATLIQRLKDGKRYVAGRRIPLMASTFEVKQPLRLVTADGEEVLVVGEKHANHDQLDGVPVI